MLLNNKIAVKGFYHIKVHRNVGKTDSHIEDCGEFPNIILNGFFSRLCSDNASKGLSTSVYMFVGTSTNTPLATDTVLGNLLGSASNAGYINSLANVKEGSNYFMVGSVTCQWNQGAIIGNISEVGVKIQGSGTHNNLDSRALILDVNGNPTTITLTAEDQLIITYTMKAQIPTTPFTTVQTINGISTTVTMETLHALNSTYWNFERHILSSVHFSSGIHYSNAQGLINNVETGTPASTYYDSVPITYTGNNVDTRTCIIQATINDMNSASNTIEYIRLHDTNSTGYPKIGIHFNPPLTKLNTMKLDIPINFIYTRG